MIKTEFASAPLPIKCRTSGELANILKQGRRKRPLLLNNTSRTMPAAKATTARKQIGRDKDAMFKIERASPGDAVCATR